MKTAMQKVAESKVKMIDQKIESIFLAINAAYKRGEIQSEAEYNYRLIRGLIEFYSSIGLPTYKFRAAMATPVSSDYNQMVKEFIEDIKMVFSESSRTIKMLENAFSEMEQERQLMQAQIRYINKKAQDMSRKIGDANTAIEINSFMSAEALDPGMIKTKQVNINTTEGLITLALQKTTDLTSMLQLKVDDSSNGLPGNSHVVSFFEDAIRFEGEDALNVDPKAIVDSNRDTWFEYESFKVSSNTYDTLSGYGFDYKEGKMWITEDNQLLMTLTLLLEDAREANWITLSPFIPEHKGSMAATLVDVIIDDCKGTKQSLLKGPIVFDDDVVIPFEKQVFKKAYVTLLQQLPYEIEVGHIAYKEVIGNQSVFQTGERTRPVEGPKPSIESIGLYYNSSTGGYEQPSTQDELKVDVQRAAKDLFEPKVKDKLIGSIAAINAKRFHIGIRNITVSCNDEFAPESEFVSMPINVSSAIESVRIEASEILSGGLDEDMLIYEISIDDGQSWHPICPVNRKPNGPMIFYINTQTPSSLRKENIGYLDAIDDVYSLRYKITLKRPINQAGITPVVKEVKVIIETGGSDEY